MDESTNCGDIVEVDLANSTATKTILVETGPSATPGNTDATKADNSKPKDTHNSDTNDTELIDVVVDTDEINTEHDSDSDDELIGLISGKPKRSKTTYEMWVTDSIKPMVVDILKPKLVEIFQFYMMVCSPRSFAILMFCVCSVSFLYIVIIYPFILFSLIMILCFFYFCVYKVTDYCLCCVAEWEHRKDIDETNDNEKTEVGKDIERDGFVWIDKPDDAVHDLDKIVDEDYQTVDLDLGLCKQKTTSLLDTDADQEADQ